MTGILSADERGPTAGCVVTRSRPATAEEVLLDELSLAYATRPRRADRGCDADAAPRSALAAFEHGGGVSLVRLRSRPARGHRRRRTGRSSTASLGSGWLPAIARRPRSPAGRPAPAHARRSWPAAKAGRRSRWLRAYPKVRVNGQRIDLDEPLPSTRLAANAATDRGRRSRQPFRRATRRDPALRERLRPGHDLRSQVHDLSQPGRRLTACRGLRAPGGAMLVADEQRERDLHGAPATPSSA